MKQAVLLVFISWFLSAFSYKAMAQETKSKEKKSEEIIIRRSGDKDVTMTIQITGDKILVNGKPITEFKSDSGISINKRNITVWDRDHSYDEHYGTFGNDNFIFNSEGGSKVVLGVVTEKSGDGAKINEVTKGSAAEKAGLQAGDIITKFGQSSIDDPQELYDAVNDKKPNDEVTIEYKRNGSTKTAKAVLLERKDRTYGMTTPGGTYKSYSAPKVLAPTIKGGKRIPHTPDPFDQHAIEETINESMDFAFSFGRPKLGLKIQDTEDEKGVKVISVDENSASAKAGMKSNDIVTEIGGKKVMNTDEAREALMENESKSLYKIVAIRNGKAMTFDIKIPKKLKTANL